MSEKKKLKQENFSLQPDLEAAFAALWERHPQWTHRKWYFYVAATIHLLGLGEEEAAHKVSQIAACASRGDVKRLGDDMLRLVLRTNAEPTDLVLDDGEEGGEVVKKPKGSRPEGAASRAAKRRGGRPGSAGR